METESLISRKKSPQINDKYASEPWEAQMVQNCSFTGVTGAPQRQFRPNYVHVDQRPNLLNHLNTVRFAEASRLLANPGPDILTLGTIGSGSHFEANIPSLSPIIAEFRYNQQQNQWEIKGSWVSAFLLVENGKATQIGGRSGQVDWCKIESGNLLQFCNGQEIDFTFPVNEPEPKPGEIVPGHRSPCQIFTNRLLFSCLNPYRSHEVDQALKSSSWVISLGGRGSGSHFEVDLPTLSPGIAEFSYSRRLGTWQVRTAGIDAILMIDKENGAVQLGGASGKNGWVPIKCGNLLQFHNGDRLEFSLPNHLEVESHVPNVKYRNGLVYTIVSNPERLVSGCNIPGSHTREIISVRDDQETRDFIEQGMITAAQHRTRVFKWGKSEAESLFSYTTSHFKYTWEDTDEGWRTTWEALAKKYHDLKVSLGIFIAERTGCCRHQATALQLLYQEWSLESRFVRGTIKVNGKNCRHAWVEVLIDGKWHVADPAQRYFKEKTEAYQKRGYIVGSNEVEMPITENLEPGAHGTALFGK